MDTSAVWQERLIKRNRWLLICSFNKHKNPTNSGCLSNYLTVLNEYIYDILIHFSNYIWRDEQSQF